MRIVEVGKSGATGTRGTRTISEMRWAAGAGDASRDQPPPVDMATIWQIFPCRFIRHMPPCRHRHEFFGHLDIQSV